VTWNQFAGGNGPQPGVDYEAVPVGTALIPGGGSAAPGIVDISNCAQFWLENPELNYGLIVKATNEAPNSSQNHFLVTSERHRGGLDIDDTRLVVSAQIVQLIPVIATIDVDEVQAVEFDSQPAIHYALEYTVGTNGVVDTGARLVGNGGTMQFYDPAGFDTGKTYQVSLAL